MSQIVTLDKQQLSERMGVPDTDTVAQIFVWAATDDRRLPVDAAALIVDLANTRTLSAASGLLS